MTEKGTFTISFNKELEGNPQLYEEYAKFIKVVRDLENSKGAEEKVFVPPVRDEQTDAMIGVLATSLCSLLGETSVCCKKAASDGLWSCFCIAKKLAFEQRPILEMYGDSFIVSHGMQLVSTLSFLPSMFPSKVVRSSCVSSIFPVIKEEHCDIASEEEKEETDEEKEVKPVVTEETIYEEKECEEEFPTQFQGQGLPPDALLFANNLLSQFGPIMSGLAAMQKTQPQ